MKDTGTGGKGLIFRDREFLVLVKPNGKLDFTGGRDKLGERSEDALIRETAEETKLTVNIIAPVYQWSFYKASGRLITGVTYLCSFLGGRITLSPEHAAYYWAKLSDINHPDLTRWIDFDWLKTFPWEKFDPARIAL